MPTSATQIFLSHNFQDKPTVLEIKRWLESQTPTVPCWIDSENLSSQNSWVQQLEQIITTCRAAMVFYGPHGMGPVHEGERQLLDARAFQRTDNFFLIPVLLPGAQKGQVTGFTKLHNWVDLSQGLENEAARQRLLAFARGVAPQSLLPEDEIPADLAPFRGLDRFDDGHAHYFFGRDRDIETLCESLRKQSFVMVIGGSGSGKSSLVRAGLHTPLAKDTWPSLATAKQIPVLPGSKPLRKLAEAIVRGSCKESQTSADEILQSIDFHEKRFHERAREEADGLLTALNTLFPSPQQTVVLVIDQF
ncbi:MAG: toll/interleukin-1 receptor domain-containing protein, partial [Planctomycetota bacterium]